MGIQYQIIPNFSTRNTLILPESLGEIRKHSYLRFGHLTKEIQIIISSELVANEMIISNQILQDLNIPIFPKYEINLTKTEIVLGPFIGILECKKQKNLDEVVQNLTNYVYDYEAIGGAVLVFSEEGIDLRDQVIHGYMYHPEENNWVFGVYPYPASLFRRTGMKKGNREHLQSILGDKIFNNYIFDKWEMHDWLSKDLKIAKHLPETILYTKPTDVLWFLDYFSEAYIKPIAGSQGIGILKVLKKNEEIQVKQMIDHQVIDLTFASLKEVKAYFNNHLTKNKWIIQEAIDVLKKDDVMIDFRMLLVRGYTGEWVNTGIIARYGVKQSIVSNISSGGYASMAETVFREICEFSEQQIYEITNKMTQVAIEAANAMEEFGIHCGNLGVDLALDLKADIWIIEINNKNPNHTVAIDAGNKQLFYETKKLNMLYAKKLAGF